MSWETFMETLQRRSKLLILGSAAKQADGGFAGDLFEMSGPRFDASPLTGDMHQSRCKSLAASMLLPRQALKNSL